MSQTNPGTNISGKNLLLFIQRSGDASYLLAACQVDLQFTMSQAVNAETTKCGVTKNFAPVDAKATMNAEARVDIAEGDDAISWNDFVTMQQNETQFSAKIVDPDGKIYIEGDAKLAQAELTADATTSVKFSANLEYLEPAAIVLTQPTT